MKGLYEKIGIGVLASVLLVGGSGLFQSKQIFAASSSKLDLSERYYSGQVYESMEYYSKRYEFEYKSIFNSRESYLKGQYKNIEQFVKDIYNLRKSVERKQWFHVKIGDDFYIIRFM